MRPGASAGDGGAGIQEERELIDAIRAGDREACAALVRAHYERVYRFLRHLSGDDATAEDLTQEVFAAAWGTIAGFRGEASIGTWLHKIAYGKFVDSTRRKRREDAATKRLADGQTAATVPDDAVQRAWDAERKGAVYRAVQSLDDEARSVIALHYFHGMSYSEMAEVLGKPVGTVKWQTSEALRELKHRLDGRI